MYMYVYIYTHTHTHWGTLKDCYTDGGFSLKSQ